MTSDPTPSPDGSSLAQTAGDAARWYRAVAIASTMKSPTSGGPTKRRRRDKLASSVVILVLTVTGLVLAYGRRSGPGASDPSMVTGTRVGLQVGLTVLGVTLLVIGVVVAMRSGQWRARTAGPLTVLTREQRRTLMSQLRGQRPLQKGDEQVLIVLRAVALGLLRPWGAVLVMCGLVVNVAGQAVGAPRWAGLSVLWLISVAVCAVASVLLLRDQAVAEQFLERHPVVAARSGTEVP